MKPRPEDEDRGVPEMVELLTYVAGEPGPGIAPPRVGDAVELRALQGGRAVEAFSAAGQRLGRLPSVERDTLASLLPEGWASLRGQIDALVPRPCHPGEGRIHIRVRAG